jgi:hypothetical protein
MAQSAGDRRRAQRALARKQREIRAGRSKPTVFEPYRLARARQRGMHIIAQDGISIDTGQVTKGMTKAERSRNGKYLNDVRKMVRFATENPDYIKTPEGAKEFNKLVRKVESYEGKQTGGDNSREYASDPQVIIESYLADPESFHFEDAYEDAA